MIKNSVQCDSCGLLLNTNWDKFHADSDKFYTIDGNVFVGLQGGVIGNNFVRDDDDNIASINSKHYCKPCLAKILGMKL